MKHLLLYILLAGCLLASCRPERPRYVIGVSQCSDDEWRHQQNTEIMREAGFYRDLQVVIRTAKDNNERQIRDIRRFLNEGVDLLVVSPNEAEPITPVVEEAYERGIPVIVVDRKILSDKYTAYIGADNDGIGYAIGNYIANSLHGRGTVVEITGLSGSTPAMERHEGFTRAIRAYPDIQLLAVADGAWLRDQAEAKMDSLLDVYPHFDVLYAHNDRMADGAYEAAARRGREQGIRFFGTDALSGESYGLESVLRGKLDATFIYPTGGDEVVHTAMAILTGKPFERETNLNTSVVDSTTAPLMHLSTLTENGGFSNELAHLALTDQALWNSVAVIDTGVVVAVGGINGRVEMIKGYPVRLLQAACGKPTVDGVATEGEGYMRSNSSQIMLGTQTGTQTMADFAYDEDSLYFIARTADPTFVSRRGTTDNVRLMIDADNVSATSPQEGMYCFSFRRDAVCRAWHGGDGSWNETDASMINMRVTSGEQSYTVEAAIPWSALGKSEPPVGQRMAATVEIENVGEDATTTERMPDAQRNESWTYMEFRLAGDAVTDGIDKTDAQDGDGVDMRVSGGTLFISSNEAVREMTVCSADGRIVARMENPGTRFSKGIAHKGIAVVRLILSDGRSVSRKTAF